MRDQNQKNSLYFSLLTGNYAETSWGMTALTAISSDVFCTVCERKSCFLDVLNDDVYGCDGFRNPSCIPLSQ